MAGDISIEVRGHEQLGEVGRRFKAAGAGKLRRELLTGIRGGAKPTIPRIRSHAASTLPGRGGLAATYAAKPISVRSSLSVTSASVRIESTARGRLRDVNAGRLSHPVFGDRRTWVQQSVKPGWFTEPIERSASKFRQHIEHAMDDVGRRIEKG